jgi:hypothetical protein
VRQQLAKSLATQVPQLVQWVLVERRQRQLGGVVLQERLVLVALMVWCSMRRLQCLQVVLE